MLEWLHAVHHSHREYLLVKAKHLSFPSSGRQEGWIDSCFVAMEKTSDLFSEITSTKKHLGPGDVPLTWGSPFPSSTWELTCVLSDLVGDAQSLYFA